MKPFDTEEAMKRLSETEGHDARHEAFVSVLLTDPSSLATLHKLKELVEGDRASLVAKMMCDCHLASFVIVYAQVGITDTLQRVEVAKAKAKTDAECN